MKTDRLSRLEDLYYGAAFGFSGGVADEIPAVTSLKPVPEQSVVCNVLRKHGNRHQHRVISMVSNRIAYYCSTVVKTSHSNEKTPRHYSKGHNGRILIIFKRAFIHPETYACRLENVSK